MTHPFNPINQPKTPVAAIMAAAVFGCFALIIVMAAIVTALLRPPPEETKAAVGITKISTTPTTEPPTTTTTEAPTTTKKRVTTTTADTHDTAVAVLLVALCTNAPITSGGLNYCDTKPSDPTFVKMIGSGCTLLNGVDPRHTKSRTVIVDDLATKLVSMQSQGELTKGEAGDIATFLGGVLSSREDLCP